MPAQCPAQWCGCHKSTGQRKGRQCPSVRRRAPPGRGGAARSASCPTCWWWPRSPSPSSPGTSTSAPAGDSLHPTRPPSRRWCCHPEGLALPVQHAGRRGREAARVVAGLARARWHGPCGAARRPSARVARRRAGHRPRDREPLYRQGSGTVTPASTMKLLTSMAALEAIGPDHRFETTVRRVPGTNRIVLVGGGDPFLQPNRPRSTSTRIPPTSQSLARRTASALRADGTRKVRLAYDDSLFAGPARRSTGRRRTSGTAWCHRSRRSGWTRAGAPPASATWTTRRARRGRRSGPRWRSRGSGSSATWRTRGARLAPGTWRSCRARRWGRSCPGWCWSATTTPPRWWRTTWAGRCARTPRSPAVRSPYGRCCASSAYLSRTP